MLRIVLLGLAMATTACQMDASIVALNTPVPKFPAKVTGVVSSSLQSGYVGSSTAPSYRVQATVGATTSQMKQVTADGQYVVFSSVQGALIAD